MIEVRCFRRIHADGLVKESGLTAENTENHRGPRGFSGLMSLGLISERLNVDSVMARFDWAIALKVVLMQMARSSRAMTKGAGP